jgi:hypothetical protein
MDLKKIAIQLFKADKARKSLNKNQLIELSTCFNLISHNRISDNFKYVPFDLDQLESVLLDSCDVTVNADLLYTFYKLGEHNEYHRISEKDLLIVVNIEQVKKDIKSYNCLDLIDLSKMYSNYDFQYIHEFFEHVLNFDLVHGIDAANIPQWILDIPVSDEDLTRVNQYLVNYVYIKGNDVLYTLSKQTRDYKNVYFFKKYTKIYRDSACLDSVQGGLISKETGANYVKRCKDLNKQLLEVISAYEIEQDRQKVIAQQARNERESKTA